MAECSKCGKESMSFTCRYCGKKFCSEHRLPENHDCEGLEESIEKEKEENSKWFKEEKVKNPSPSKVRKPSLLGDIKHSLKSNMTMTIIVLTAFSFMLQIIFGNYTDLLRLSPALTQSAVDAMNSAVGFELLKNTLFQKPWSLLTVMLVHGDLFHIFANMVTFYFFGTTLERNIGSRELLKFYLFSGLLSSLAFVGFRNVLYAVHGPLANGIPTLGPSVGASGAVVAVFAAVAMLYPHAEVLLYFIVPMRIKTALYAFAGLETVNLAAIAVGIRLPVLGNFASSAHIAGLIIGIWYGRKLRDQYARKTPVLDLLS